MPKNKTHSGTKKRVKVSGAGKLLHERVGTRHRMESKSSKKVRSLSGVVEVAPQDDSRVRRMLGIGG